jgi:signal transduction histidine kinase
MSPASVDDVSPRRWPDAWIHRYRHSLLLKLAGFYLLISLPTLLVMEAAILSFEFREFAEAVDEGQLLRELRIESERIGEFLGAGSVYSSSMIARELDGWILSMERPSEGSELQSKVLLELSTQPFALMLQPLDGAAIHNARAPVWRLDPGTSLPPPAQAREIARQDSPDWMRRFSAPVYDAAGTLRGQLLLEVRLPLPWRPLLFKFSYEWPLLVANLLVFAIGTVLFFNRRVTTRLQRIAVAANAWRRGQFAGLIDDPSEDELGVLSRRLDRMAADLRDLMHARADVAMLNERARLARDLHDTVKQKAFALTMQLAALRAALVRSGGGPGAALDESRKLAEEIQRELVLILDEMRRDDGAETFHDELSARIHAWARRSGVQLRVDLSAAALVQAEHRDTLARLVDEALANVQRHSGATAVEVALVQRGGELSMTIADNGRGMTPGRSEGMGLRNMRHRVADLPGGLLHMEATAGVRIMVTWKQPEPM